MQVKCDTGEVYAMSKAIASGEELELVTIGPSHYTVVCWWTDDDEVRWARDFNALAPAVEEYNKYALNKERVPSFN